MKMFKRKFAALLMFAISMPTFADSEGGLILGLEAEKKINKRLDISMETDMRTRNNFKTMDRWGIGLGASYKLLSWLKADAGYKFLDYNFHEDINYKANGLYNNWRPSYWGVKHRFYASLTGSYKFSNNIKLSLRERWQYTYRPQTTTERYDFDNSWWEDTDVKGKGKNVLRSRLQVKYDIPHSKITPYASVELYNARGLQKTRYTLGADWKITKQHEIGAFYRYQNVKDDDDPNGHILGLNYTFKF